MFTMKHSISIFLLFVIGLAACRELKTKKPDISHAEDAKLTNDVAIKPPEAGSNVASNSMTILRLLKKRSPGRERYGYYNGGRARSRNGGSSSSSSSDSSSGSSSDSSSERHSRYGGRSHESHYGNSQYEHRQHVPYHGSRHPTYGSRHIGVGIRHGNRPYATNPITGNEIPKIKDCDCPFSQHNEPAVESTEYDLEFLRQWQTAFSSHPCCRERWEAYSSNSK